MAVQRRFGLLEGRLRRGQAVFQLRQRNVINRRRLTRHAVVIHHVHTVGGDVHLIPHTAARSVELAFNGDAVPLGDHRLLAEQKAAVLNWAHAELAKPTSTFYAHVTTSPERDFVYFAKPIPREVLGMHVIPQNMREYMPLAVLRAPVGSPRGIEYVGVELAHQNFGRPNLQSYRTRPGLEVRRLAQLIRDGRL